MRRPPAPDFAELTLSLVRLAETHRGQSPRSLVDRVDEVLAGMPRRDRVRLVARLVLSLAILRSRLCERMSVENVDALLGPAPAQQLVDTLAGR